MLRGRVGRVRRNRVAAGRALVGAVMAGVLSFPLAAPGAAVAPPPGGRAAPAPGPAGGVTLALRPSDPAGLEALAAAVSDPRSPRYRRYMSPAAFRRSFGAPPSVVRDVRAWASARGLQVATPGANGLAVRVTGPQAALSRVFGSGSGGPPGRHAELRVGGTRPAMAPGGTPGAAPAEGEEVTAGDPLPAGVAAVIRDAGRVHPLFERDAPGTRASASDTTDPCAPADSVGGYPATEVASAYGFSDLYRQGLLGYGQTIASFQLADYSDSDLAQYAACQGLTPQIQRVPVDGGAALGPASSEPTADLEVLASLAPGARILVYEAPDTGRGVYDNLAAIVSQDRAQVVVTSWGTCELNLSPDAAGAENTLLQEAALQGQTVLAASGDGGSTDCASRGGSSALSVSDPASQPFVTGVGGTSLTSSSPRAETTWNNRAGAGGGGLSRLWAMPAWQTRAAPAFSSGQPCGATSGWCREVPDVSAHADVTRGYRIFCTVGDCAARPGWAIAGGTSLAAPVWAALVAITDEACPTGPAGFLNPALYASPGATNDVTAGSNDLAGTGLYPAGSGYDMATGLGSPSAAAAVAALCPATAPASSGYRLVASDGGVFTFGDAGFFGSMGGRRLNAPIVGLAPTVDGRGYWMVAADGGVFTFGDAGFFGSMGGRRLNAPIVGLAPTVDGRGYWMVAADGGVFTFGDAPFLGSAAPTPSRAPAVALAADPATGGYWLVLADGTVRGFGAPVLGWAPMPAVAMAPTADGAGYWVAAGDGSVAAFGDAVLHGSAAALRPSSPIIGMAASRDGLGYWLVGADGGVFSFGDAAFRGSTGNLRLNRAVVGMATSG